MDISKVNVNHQVAPIQSKLTVACYLYTNTRLIQIN